MKWCFMPPVYTLFRLNWAHASAGGQWGESYDETCPWVGSNQRPSDENSSTLPLDYRDLLPVPKGMTICIWYWLECEMGLSQPKCLNPAWAWKARAGFGYECWDNPSSTTTNTICIFSHVTSILSMFRILLWAHLWHIYRDVFISVLS